MVQLVLPVQSHAAVGLSASPIINLLCMIPSPLLYKMGKEVIPAKTVLLVSSSVIYRTCTPLLTALLIASIINVEPALYTAISSVWLTWSIREITFACIEDG